MTHLDLKGGVSQKLLQAVTTAVVTMSHPHFVLARSPLRPYGEQQAQPTRARYSPPSPTREMGAVTVAPDLGRDGRTSCPEGTVPRPSFYPKT